MRFTRQQQLDNLIKFGMSKEEAEDVLAYDEKVEKSKAKDAPLEYDLPKEVEKQVIKEAHKDKKIKTTYDFSQRARKANPTKSGIIDFLTASLIEGGYAGAEKKNPEREIIFSVDGNEFSLVLTQHRKPKAK